MAKRLILGENSAGDYGLFVSKPGFDVSLRHKCKRTSLQRVTVL